MRERNVGALRRLNHIEASLLAWRTTSRTGRINCTRRLPSHGNEQPSPTSSTPGSVTGVLARHRVTALRLPEVIDPGVSYGAARDVAANETRFGENRAAMLPPRTHLIAGRLF